METHGILTPLTVVLAFIGIVEATFAYRVKDLHGKPQAIFVWFMVSFPVLILIGFFVVQFRWPASWYPPSELAKASPEILEHLESTNRQKSKAVDEASTVIYDLRQQLLKCPSNSESSEQAGVLAVSARALNDLTQVTARSDTIISPISAPKSPEFGIIFGSFPSLDKANDEIKSTSQTGLAGSKVYKKLGRFRVLVTASSRDEADEKLDIARQQQDGAYLVNMSTWCPNPTENQGAIECKSS